MNALCRLCLVSLLAFAPALAQAHCERPTKPSFPDPKTADPAVVEKLDQDMQKYAPAMNAYIACMTKETQDADAEGAATINVYNQKFLPEYNKRAAGQ